MVVHILERRQTLAILAQLYGVPVEAILAANPGIVPEHIPIGARVDVPPPVQGWPSYTLQPGETLTDLASRCACPVEVLWYLNPLSRSIPVVPGQALQVPRLPAARPPDVAPSAPSPTPLEGGPWVEVHLANGARAWAPRASLIVGSPSPLEPSGVIEMAQRFLGSPYRWGGQTPNGVDCSGYVQQVFDLAGHHLPRLADEQFAQTVPVSPELAQPGDLVFFSTYAPGPSHVGIFLGNGRFLHASSSHGVTEANLSEPYFATRCLGIHRIKDWSGQSVGSAVAPSKRDPQPGEDPDRLNPVP